MTIGRDFYTNHGDTITIKNISKSSSVPGKLCMTAVLNGKEYTSDHVEPEKLQKFVDNQEVNKKIAILKDRKEFIEKAGINKLYYFTSVDNLESILKNGILSKTELMKRGITYTPNRLRANLNSNDISLSISHFNYELLNRLSNHNRKFDTIVLVTNAEPLMMIDTEFAKNSTSYSRIEKTDDIKKIYEGDRTFLDAKGGVHNLPASYPTSPNAEALVKGAIDVKDIINVLSLTGVDNATKKMISRLAYGNGKDYYTVNEYWPRCDQKAL